jgi:hypothetical protein
MRRQGIENQNDKPNHEPEKEKPESPAPASSGEALDETPLEDVEPDRQTGPLKAGKPVEEGTDLQAVHTQMIQSLSAEEHKELFMSMAGFSDFLRNTNRLFWTNFLMGLARGIGFVIGVSIIGAIFVTVWNELLSVTGIGNFLARIMEEMHKHVPK